MSTHRFISGLAKPQVWIDGVVAVEHRTGGYTGFGVEVPAGGDDASDMIEVAVLVDNRWNATVGGEPAVPTHAGNSWDDFYYFGGIHRDVVLYSSPAEGRIDRVRTVSDHLHRDGASCLSF